MSSSHDYVRDKRNDNIKIYINGRFYPRNKANISVFDSGFLLGDGIWESHWYQNVQQSTGFTPYHEKDITIPDLYKDLLNDCMNIYEELYRSKINF